MTDPRPGFRIAMIGSRGIPARYGGFETFAQELAPRLVDRGHDVLVYCRPGYTADTRPATYKGVHLRYTPALRSRALEQLSHEFTSIADSIRRPIDLYYFLGYRGAPLYLPIRASRRLAVVNTDGLEWRRRKWNRIGRTYLRAAEWMVAHGGADELVSDARAISDYFAAAHGASSTHLTNGAYVLNDADCQTEVLERYHLKKGSYLLVACRIEPENNIDLIVKEYIQSQSPHELIIAGGMNYKTPYWNELQELARGHSVRFLGPVYGAMEIESLHLGAYAYVHGHEVGGTNPALLKAMGCANLVLALDNVFNRENLARAGRYWTKAQGSLAGEIRWADTHAEEARRLAVEAQDRIGALYTWDSVADAHDAFFRAVAESHGVAPVSSTSRYAG